MNEPTKAVYAAIRQETERALEYASTLPADERKILGAVNWGDIGAGEVVFCRDEHGDTWFTVEIGEASPGVALEGFVRVRS